MSGPYGDLTPARRVKVAAIAGADVVCTLYGIDDSDDEPGVYWRQGLGVRAYPEDGVAEAIATLDGPYRELVLAYHPKCKLPAGQAKGSTWVYSHGANPRILEVTDDRMNLGQGATEQLVLGTTYRTAEAKVNNKTATALAALPVVAVDPATTMALVNTIRTLLAVWGTDIAAMEADAAKYLSTKHFTL